MSASGNLQQRLERFERERLEAYQRYNDALTALDRSIGLSSDLPHPPPAYDLTGLDVLNRSWDLLPTGPPAIDRSLKGRLRGFIWRLVGPMFDTQRQFNAALVDHLNRNRPVHDERERVAASTLVFLGEQLSALSRFQAHLIQYAQTITALVDSNRRSAVGTADAVNTAVSSVSDEVLRWSESVAARDARRNQVVESVRTDVDAIRASAALAQQTALSLKREVERLLASGSAVARADGPVPAPPAPQASLDSFKYLGFENEFRGAVEDIRHRLEAYLPLFEGQRDVLDVGCGRGEFLDLLRSRQISARGIDINDAMVEEARSRGLDAEKADALSYLSALPDEALGGVFAAQVIEHLPADYLEQVVEQAARVLRPGGVIVLETINPTCWVAFFESYIRDLTHVRPLHPETMQYLLRVSGFSTVRLQYSSPVPEEGRLSPVSADLTIDDPLLRQIVEAVNRNVAVLNGRMFGFQDYAVVGTK